MRARADQKGKLKRTEDDKSSKETAIETVTMEEEAVEVAAEDSDVE
eukprot:gene39122-48316_t